MQIIRLTASTPEPIILTQSGKYLIELTQPGIEAEIVGMFQVQQREIMNLEVVIHHQAPHTKATTTLKGVARDHAKVRFLGRIIIDPDCGNSNSFLTERILLLSDTASAEAIPELEILTDDVKCSHAASISQIPAEHLFYLQSRGIPRAEAEALIINGFLQI